MVLEGNRAESAEVVAMGRWETFATSALWSFVESALRGEFCLHTSNDSALFIWLGNGLDDVKNADENVMACKLRMIGRYKTRT